MAAIKKLKWEGAAIDFQDYDNEAQEYADLEADNRIAELAVRDEEKSQFILSKLPGDFDLQLLGGLELKRIDFGKDGLASEVNKGDENSEWLGDMPEFNPGGSYIRLIYHFKTEDAREAYCKDNNINVDFKKSNQWIVYQE